jgi:hypothetical protein
MSSAAAMVQSTCGVGWGRVRKTEAKAQEVVRRGGVGAAWWKGTGAGAGEEEDDEAEEAEEVEDEDDDEEEGAAARAAAAAAGVASGIPCGIALRLAPAASSAGCRYPSNQRLKHES